MGLTFEEQAGEMFEELRGGIKKLKEGNTRLTAEYKRYKNAHEVLLSEYMEANDTILSLRAKIKKLEQKKE